MSFIARATKLFPVTAKKLTSAARDALPSSEFVFPKQRKYPIADISHARDALARASGSHNPAIKHKVFMAVYRKFPQLRKPGTALHSYVKAHRAAKRAGHMRWDMKDVTIK